MFSKYFWIAAFERAVKTFAQAVGGIASGNAILNIADIDFAQVLQLAAVPAFLSIVTSLASIPISTGNSPSLVPNAEVNSAEE